MAEPVSSPSAATAAARGGFLAAIFLMATSAIGPGFITQTATFTAKLGSAFAFAILASILIDFVVQLNIWRITALTRRNASDTANAAIPGAGYFLAVLILVGGLAFNVGNIAGAGLGLNAMFGLDPKIGGAASALFAIGIFLSRRAGLLLDRSIIGLGLLMTVVLAMIGIYNGLVSDALAVVKAPMADVWVVEAGTKGPFAEASSIPADTRDAVARMPGVAEAGAVNYQNVEAPMLGARCGSMSSATSRAVRAGRR